MRKHDVRKWLHAVLDLLPVILIPVFMIYSHRHTLTERTEVEINFKYESNEVNTLDDLVVGNIYTISNIYIDDLSNDFDILLLSGEFYITTNDLQGSNQQNYDSNINNYVEVKSFEFNNTRYCYAYFTNFDYNIFCSIDDIDIVSANIIISSGLENIKNIFLQNDVLPQYTDYNVIESVSVNDTNKDIMTVFMDDFNGAIDNYFNMGNVFNLNGVYQWFNTNIFSGNAPTVIYSIWNIALYELVMDLLFLLYGLFMWFIDMIQKLMEKPLNCVK